MSNLLTDNSDCCGISRCPDPEIQNIPGPQGEPGAPCTPCDDGQNAFTSTTANFTQPSVAANVSVQVADSTWIVIGQELFIETGGYYLVVSKADSTHVTVKNRGYTGNASPGATISSSAHVGPAGIKGTDGSGAGSAFLIANNLSEGTPNTMRSNLGLGTMAVETATDYLSKAGNLAGLANVATSRANLGVAIGSDVLGYTTMMDALSDLSPLAAGRMFYTTGTDVFAAVAVATYGLTWLSTSSAANARSTLGGVLPRYGCLGFASAVDMNAGNTDTVISIESTKYRIDKIIVTRASISLTTATVAAYTAPAAGGTAIANNQAVSALTAVTKFMDLVLQAIVGTDYFTGANVYFRVGTAQGSAAVANVYVMGWALD